MTMSSHLEKLKVLMKVHERATLKDFQKNGAVWSPKWLLENERGQRLLIATALEGKDIATVARDAIREFGAVRYAFCMESWFLMPNDHEGLAIRPSEHPLRREGVFLSGEDNKGERIVINYEIKRREGSKPWLEKMDVSNADLSGRLTDMFAVGPYE